MAQKLRGTDARQELNDEYLTRDVRSSFQKIADGLKNRTTLVVLIVLLGGMTIYVPAASSLFVIFALLLAWFGLTRVDECPIKLPIQANRGDKKYLDPHEVDSYGKPKAAGGIFYLGNEGKSGKEIWLTNDDCRQHFLILGTTGAGKTELLVGFCANALSWASGFLIVDGKGDVAVFAKIHALARRFGRDDDLLVLNFMTGEKPAGTILSNTMNPFSTGSSDSLTQMIVSLMDDVGGDGAMWKGRATAMLTGVMRALSYLRDEGELDLNVGAIRDHMGLKKIIDLADDKQYPHLSQEVRHTIKSYLTSLPGFQPEKGYKQAQTTLDQHGYLEMQFTKILGSLADVYGHIFATPYGEVDMYDVVINRRILIVMLPALEKSSDEVANLGKIVVASLKRMMGMTLGNKLEGSYEEIVLKRLTNSSSPFVAICDEVGYYCVDGMDLMAAQARSLGFSMTYAAQDINGMKRLNDKIVGSIIGNTNTKIIMRIEDPETAKMTIELAGKAYRPTVGGFTGQSGEASMNYADNMEARVEEVDRIRFLDMKAQRAGQMTIVYKDMIIRGQSFYADPESSLNRINLKLRANHLLKVKKPSRDSLEQASKLPEIMEILTDPDMARERVAEERKALARIASQASPGDDIGLVAKGFAAYRSVRPANGPIAASCAALANVVLVRRGQIDALARRLAPIEAEDDEDIIETVARRGTAAPVREAALAGAFDDRPPRPDDLFGRGGAHPDDMFADGRGRFDDPRAPFGDPRAPFGDPRAPFDDLRGGARRPADMDDDDDDALGDIAGDRRRSPFAARRDIDELARQPRMPSRSRRDIEHSLEVSGRPMDGAVDSSNDAVFRLLAELDVDPDTTSREDFAAGVERAIGSDSRREVPVPPAAIDAVAHEADMALPPSVEDAGSDAPIRDSDNKDFFSDFFNELIDDEEDKK